MNAQPRNLEPAMTASIAPSPDDAKWEAVVRRDPAADGTFYYSVKTTGVYCRPSCPTGRQALRPNVAFHPTAEAAEAAGFRPCKRCSPKGGTLAEERAAKVAAACRALEAEEPPALDELARGAGLSPYHFHRVFKAVTGLTPKAYAVAHRARRVREELARRPTVTEAIYEAGFQSNSPFYAKSAETLGMTPTGFRNGGAGVTLRFAVAQGSLGAVLVAASEVGVCAISLGDEPDALVRELQDRFPKARLIGGDAEFERRVAQVIGFIEAPRTGLDLPLDVQGTAFQQKVWQALREIPAGATASYADVARRIGAPKAVRAVAQACAANPLAVAIPCHRVVRHDGHLSGYRWGVERKSALLAREAGV